MNASLIKTLPLGHLPMTPELGAWLLRSCPLEEAGEGLARICTSYPKHDRSLTSALAAAIEDTGLLAAPSFLEALDTHQFALEQTPLGQGLLASLAELRGDPAEALRLKEKLRQSHASPDATTELDLARLLTRVHRHDEACGAIRRAAEYATDFQILTKAAKQLERLKTHAPALCHRSVRIAALSPYTTDLWIPLLKLALFREGLWSEIYAPAYGTWELEILSPQSGLFAFSPDVIVLAQTWRELNLPAFTPTPEELIDARVQEVVSRWRQLRNHSSARILQHNFELPSMDPNGHLSHALFGGRAAVLHGINQALRQQAPSEGVVLMDLDQTAARVGKRTWNDASYWHMAKQYPAPTALPALVDHQVARIRAGLGLTKKVLVLDLDNTLWGGVVGEDGLAGIKIGPPSATGEAHLALQHYAKQLKERGILLAVCSKNNEADAKSPFQHHEAMHLKLDDFVAFVANWQDKPSNLRAMAQTLNLGLDSFVFLDDNPTERALMRRELPQVSVPEIGSDPSRYVEILDAKGYFEADTLSAEDLERSKSYQANAQREALKTSATSIEDFLASLQMECHHGPFTEQVLPRVVQLLGKTNQFNLTTRRHSEEKVRQLADDPRAWTQYFRLKDRFDDNGLVGVLIAVPIENEPHTWEIDTWLMSCRVIGRQMENFMFNSLLHAARAQDIRHLRGLYIPTPKNAMVANLFAGYGFNQVGNDPAAIAYELPLAQASPAPVAFIYDHASSTAPC